MPARVVRAARSTAGGGTVCGASCTVMTVVLPARAPHQPPCEAGRPSNGAGERGGPPSGGRAAVGGRVAPARGPRAVMITRPLPSSSWRSHDTPFRASSVSVILVGGSSAA